jgi:hypothetical protein
MDYDHQLVKTPACADVAAALLKYRGNEQDMKAPYLMKACLSGKLAVGHHME